MKSFTCVCLSLFLFETILGQNLVPNGNFENYSSCPAGIGQISKATPWFSTSVFGPAGSPDYFHECSIGDSDVPNTFNGYQQPHSGSGFAGIVLHHEGIVFREYISIQLGSPLTANTCYQFEMYCNLADSATNTTDAIGVYFSNSAVTGMTNSNPLPFVPQITNTQGNFFDTANWTRVSGDYQAVGGEQYIIIGNFSSDSLTTTVLSDSNVTSSSAYVFIDDVSLTRCGAQSKNVLFLGNSYTQYNNMPGLVNSVANSVGDWITYDSNTPGGYRLLNHAADNTSMIKIFSNDWDHVVLQAQSQEPSWADWQVQQDVFPYAKQLCDSIRSNNGCTEPVFYMTWGRENGDASNCANISWVCTYEGMDSVLNKNYRRMGEQNRALVSPVGAVWHYIRDHYPAMDLYAADGSHPSQLGSYVAAVTFYTIFFEKDPELTSFNYSLSAADADTIRKAVGVVVYDSLAKWNVGRFDPVSRDSIAACDGANINGIWYSSSQTITDTLHGQSMYGCDSIVTTELTVYDKANTSVLYSSCELFVSPSGNHTWDSSGQYRDTLSTVYGCDSIILIDLEINDTYEVVNDTAINSGDSLVIGSSVYITSGVYSDTLVSSDGCDSIIVSNLFVNPPTGIQSFLPEHVILLYPNPTTGKLFIESTRNITWVKLYDAVGSLAQSFETQGTKTSINTTGLDAGVYFVEVRGEDDVVMRGKVVKE